MAFFKIIQNMLHILLGKWNACVIRWGRIIADGCWWKRQGVKSHQKNADIINGQPHIVLNFIQLGPMKTTPLLNKY